MTEAAVRAQQANRLLDKFGYISLGYSERLHHGAIVQHVDDPDFVMAVIGPSNCAEWSAQNRFLGGQQDPPNRPYFYRLVAE